MSKVTVKRLLSKSAKFRKEEIEFDNLLHDGYMQVLDKAGGRIALTDDEKFDLDGDNNIVSAVLDIDGTPAFFNENSDRLHVINLTKTMLFSDTLMELLERFGF